ncbi:MAG TPA: formate dehydrogenase accessory sulfurtransferase FdhD [Acidimicrobiales bacterium]
MLSDDVALGSRAGPVASVIVTALAVGSRRERPDQVVGEEPLEVRLSGPGRPPRPVAVTMRTPGHDFELAVGFLLSEGLLTDQGDLRTVRYCDLPPDDVQRYNVVTVSSTGPFDVEERRRASTISSSCGICGTASLDQLHQRCGPLGTGPPIEAELLVELPERLRKLQRVFERTGGLHAAGLFEHTGRLLAVREDVGRHNAVDKLVGWAAMQRRLPLSSAVLVVSGRVSFEIVQKAAIAGIPALVAVSAPSSLAVDTARDLNMTLAGFVRGDRANLYAGAERVVGMPPDRRAG